MNAPASNQPASPIHQFPTYHVGHHRLSADASAEFNFRLNTIMSNGWFRCGQYSEALAHKLASFTGYKFAIPTDSGTTALAIITAYVNKVRPLRRVVVPAITYQATYNAVARALPNVYDEEVLNAANLYSASGSRASLPDGVTALIRSHIPVSGEFESGFLQGVDAVVTVGLGGKHCSYRSPDVLVIEDCCQDWITKPHTGNHRAISFDPSKVVTGLSGGGAILTDSRELAEFASAAISNSVQGAYTGSMRMLPVFGKHTITEIDALHVLIMMEDVHDRLEHRRLLMDRYHSVFGSKLNYEPGMMHDMSKAILAVKGKNPTLAREINHYLEGKNLGKVAQLYPSFSGDFTILSLPLSERFEVCPAFDCVTGIIATAIKPL